MATLNSELQSLLGSQPCGLEKLTPEQQKNLHTILVAAHKNQTEQNTKAFDAALKHVPALLRGTVRKILFG